MRRARISSVPYSTLTRKVHDRNIEAVNMGGDDRKQEKHTVEECVSTGEASEKSNRERWKEDVACCYYETLEEWDAHIGCHGRIAQEEFGA